MHYRQLPTELKPLADKFYRSQRSPMRTTAEGQVWVAEDHEIVAALCLSPANDGYWLTSLLVAATMRKHGIARQLINVALAERTTPVWLFCHPQLSSFYLGLGFQPCSHLPQPLAERLTRYQRTKSLQAFGRGHSHENSGTIAGFLHPL